MANRPSLFDKRQMSTLVPAALPANQIIDSGLDETSCFFVDGDGQEVTHGYYFEEHSDVFYVPTSEGDYYYTSEGYYAQFDNKIFEGGDFSFDLSRRKVGIPREHGPGVSVVVV